MYIYIFTLKQTFKITHNYYLKYKIQKTTTIYRPQTHGCTRWSYIKHTLTNSILHLESISSGDIL